MEWRSDGTGIEESVPVSDTDKRALVLLVGMLLIGGLVFTAVLYAVPVPTDLGVPAPPEPPSPYDVVGSALIPHAPVVVDSDADFVDQGWPGSGTESDPYVIAELEIDATGYRAGIFIGNTTSYFTVHGCLVQGATDAGIHVLNAVNGALLNNTCQSNPWYGIVLFDCGEMDIENNTCSGSGDGIYVINSDDCSIVNNVCANLTGTGILLVSSENSTISWNYCCFNDVAGISLELSRGGVLSHNTCDGNADGISLIDTCHDSVLIGNSCSLSTSIGVSVTASDNVTIRDGNALWCQSFLSKSKGIMMQWSNGSSIVNYNCSGTYGDGIYLDNCDDALVMDCVSSDNVGAGTMMSADPGDGVYTWFCDNCEFVNVTCDRNYGHGFDLWSSDNTRIENCSGSYSREYGGSVRHESYGLKLSGCAGCTVSNSTFDYNDWDGINVGGDGLRAANCSASFNGNNGITLGSSGSSIADCHMSSNVKLDLRISNSASVLMRNNVMTGMGMFIQGTTASYWNSHDIDSSNTVNGRPVVYWKNATTGTLPGGASQVILGSCTGVTVEEQDLRNVSCGILMGFSSWNTVRNNTCALNRYGIYLQSSDNNSFFWNSIAASSAIGLYIYSGHDNVIWNNSFVANAVQADDDQRPLDNLWNITGRGNYWSEWTSPDVNYDGIVDNPYLMPSGAYDYYPLADQPPGIPEFSPVVFAAMTGLLGTLLLILRRRSSR